MFSRMADLIDRRPRRVLAVSLVIAAVAAVFGVTVHEHLKPRGFDVPGSGSTKARELVAHASGTDPGNSVLALVHLPARYGTQRARQAIAHVEVRLRHDPAVVAVLDAVSARNPAMISRDRRSTYLVAALRLLDDKQQEDAGKRLLAAFAGNSSVTLGGNPVANHEISTTIENDLRRAELLAVPLIVLLSFFLFRGFVASLLAPLAGGITILVSFFLLRELASVTSLSIYALNLVTGLSLGLSIDWSLLLLSRYREERARTDDLRLALRRALPRAGHTIVFSALTVAASLACLLVFPLRFLRSMGYGGIVASTVAMLTSLIVLPTVLRLLGPRIDAWSLPRWRDPARLAKPARQWRALGQLTTRYPIPVATGVVALLILLAVPIGRIDWTTVDASSLPTSAQAFQTDRVINRSREFVRNGGIPFYLAAETPSWPAVRALANQARQLDGVRAVAPPRRLRGNTWQINLVSVDTPYSARTQRLVGELSSLGGVGHLYVGGDAAAFHDERHAIASRLPTAIAILAAATLIILFLLSGSLTAPPLALAMNGGVRDPDPDLPGRPLRVTARLHESGRARLDDPARPRRARVRHLDRLRRLPPQQGPRGTNERPGRSHGDRRQRRDRRPHRHRRRRAFCCLDRRLRQLEHHRAQDPRHWYCGCRAHRRALGALPPPTSQPQIARPKGMVAARVAPATPPAHQPRGTPRIGA
jgi:putative drug exporter of the RND superfamily